MPSPAADVTLDSRRPSPRLWIAAAAEIGVAVLVAVLLFGAGSTTSSDDPHSGMSGLHAHAHAPSIPWSAAIVAVAATTTLLLIWWAVTRERIPAALTAVGLAIVGSSEPVRAMALQSHLVAMAALEALLVAVPLLLISAWRPRQATATQRSVPWSAFVIVALLLNSTLLIGLHLPGVHTGSPELNTVPPWLAGLTITIGLAYWGAILLTTRRVAVAVRRSALVIGQEVAAILGLAAVIQPSPNMQHGTVFGLSGSTDQRLGGVLMLITCAAVTLPLARRLQTPHTADHPEAEHYVH